MAKRAQKQKRLKELEVLVAETKHVLRMAEKVLGPAEVRDSRMNLIDFFTAVFKLMAALVQASVYDGRAKLFDYVNTMDRVSFENRERLELRHIKAYLDILKEWLEWAETTLNPESPPRLRDPMKATRN